MKKLFILFLSVGISSVGFGQKVKLSVYPESASITLNGEVTKAPLKIKDDDAGSFVTVSSKGYITKSVEISNIGGTDNPVIKLVEPTRFNSKGTTRKIEFSKIVDASGKFGQIAWSTNTWEEKFKDPKFIKPITNKLSDYGYNVVGSNSIFDEKGDKGEIVIGCEISRSGKDTKGSGYQVSLMLNWSVYNVNKKRVVHSLSTGGYSSSNGKLSFDDELSNAIVDGLLGLMSDTIFQNIALAASESVGTNLVVGSNITLPNVNLTDFSGLSEMIKNAKNSVVTVKTNLGHGSGFVISESGYLITNSHVVNDATKIELIFDNGFTLSGELIKEDENRDVALVKIAGGGFKPLPVNISSTESESGMEVIAIGTPKDLQLGQTVTKGIISGSREFNEIDGSSNKYLQTDVTINLGNSGGPLISAKGEVIGIVVAKLIGEGVEGIAFAIPIEEALRNLNIHFE